MAGALLLWFHSWASPIMTSGQADQRPVVVFDGSCVFCRKQIARIQRRDTRQQFEYLPKQTDGLTRRFPQLAGADFDSGMRLVMPSGHVFVGADAVYEIARRVSIWRLAAWLYRVPILHGLCRTAYGAIAARRYALAGKCADESCPASSAEPGSSKGTSS